MGLIIIIIPPSSKPNFRKCSYSLVGDEIGSEELASYTVNLDQSRSSVVKKEIPSKFKI
jgi:hypothetical protein